MKKSKFTEQQIAFALHQAESGPSVVEVCRKMGRQPFIAGSSSKAD
jgi:putative transposase